MKGHEQDVIGMRCLMEFKANLRRDNHVFIVQVWFNVEDKTAQ